MDAEVRELQARKEAVERRFSRVPGRTSVMKLGVVGKGGTGKTTLSTLIALDYVKRGRRVVAVDTDSNPNLAPH